MNNLSNNSCNNFGISSVLLSTAIAIILAKDLSIDDQDLLGNFIQTIGQNLIMIASATSDCENKLKECIESNNGV